MRKKEIIFLSILLSIYPAFNFTHQSSEQNTDHHKDVIKILLKNYKRSNIDNDQVIAIPFDQNIYLREIIQFSHDDIKTIIKDKFDKLDTIKQQMAKENTKDPKVVKNQLKPVMASLDSFYKNFDNNQNPELIIDALKNVITKSQEYFSATTKAKVNRIAQKNECTRLQYEIPILLEALYLISTNSENIKYNQALYKRLSVKYHPDKVKQQNLDENETEFRTELFIEFSPLFKDNTCNTRLTTFIENEIKNKKDELENRPIDSIGSFVRETIKAVSKKILVQTTSHAAYVTAYKISSNLLPNTTVENELFEACIDSAYQSALKIETRLINYLDIKHYKGIS